MMTDKGYKFTSDDCRDWNRLDWWFWNLQKLEHLRAGKPMKEFEIKDIKIFEVLLNEVVKTGLYIGTKVRFKRNTLELIGYVEEPLLLNGDFVTNIERTAFSGKNSWSNYIFKYAPFSELEILEPSAIPPRQFVNLNLKAIGC